MGFCSTAGLSIRESANRRDAERRGHPRQVKRISPRSLQQSMMRSTITAVATAAAMLAFSAPAHAQTTKQTGTGDGGSPHVAKRVDDRRRARLHLVWRPSLKGREESAMMPAGKYGAAVPTRQRSSRATAAHVRIGHARAGQLHDQHGTWRSAWQIVFGKLSKAGQWGIPYQPALEIAHVPMHAAEGRRRRAGDLLHRPRCRTAERCACSGAARCERSVHAGIRDAASERRPIIRGLVWSIGVHPDAPSS